MPRQWQTSFLAQLGRCVIVAVLLPLLVISGATIDVLITHVHAGEEIHTHATRHVAAYELDEHHQHGDGDHGHSGRPLDPACDPSGDSTDLGRTNCKVHIVAAASAFSHHVREGAKVVKTVMASVPVGAQAWPPAPAASTVRSSAAAAHWPNPMICLHTVLLI